VDDPWSGAANVQNKVRRLPVTARPSVKELSIRSGGMWTAVALKRGSLRTIEKVELHQIRNTGRKHTRTINFYAGVRIFEGWRG
jgi:hypothetical protein